MATTTVLLMLGLLILLIVLGVHIVLSLIVCSFLGIYLALGNWHAAASLLQQTAYEGLRDYIFAVIPLFMLMGDFIARCGAAGDLYKIVNRGLRRVPGRLAVATVVGNAIFAAVTGVSIAAAAAFTRIAYPQMIRFGYDRTNAVGVIAGSACLGMLIPPSVLLIVWGILTEDSIGRLFVAGILPGILLAALFAGYVFVSALLRPNKWGQTDMAAAAAAAGFDPAEERVTWREYGGALGVIVMIALVLGGIWGGGFTPTEAGGVGAFGGFVVAVLKGMKPRDLLHAVYECGRTSAPILLLLIAAQMYSRLLAIGGVGNFIQSLLGDATSDPFIMLTIMVAIWLALGTLLDSVSIILLTVPLFAPLAWAAGWPPYAFAIIGVLAIEAGLLTPPFGILVYSVKGFLDDKSVTLGQIFYGSVPYWIMILITLVAVALVPGLGQWLPLAM
jgi:tripartite ATP-independent transporter DctM subunit